MAKTIKNVEKLIRRSKAVVAVWGTRDHYGYSRGVELKQNVWLPFKEALNKKRISRDDILKISKYRDEK